ncbi:MAG: triose-phosphate isomerase [Anaerolineae bacterium]|nr:triose-phosphate isomerase [Anaerolineae bacterium]
MRKPLALANWKMEMTVARSLAFVRDFQSAIGDLAQEVDIILCPPYTALYPMAQALKDSPITLGGQNVSTAPGGAYTGEISAALLADVGCRWVMLGHWEVRRHFGDTDETVNLKLHAAQRAGLSPILLVGEARGEQDRFREALAAQLQRVLEGCDARQIEEMVVLYEPEWTINVEEPASPEHVGAGCGFIREWLAGHYGASAAQAVRIIYGGSVTPAHARDLLGAPDVDGLGAGRKGRQVEAFAEIVRLIAAAKGLVTASHHRSCSDTTPVSARSRK